MVRVLMVLVVLIPLAAIIYGQTIYRAVITLMKPSSKAKGDRILRKLNRPTMGKDYQLSGDANVRYIVDGIDEALGQVIGRYKLCLPPGVTAKGFGQDDGTDEVIVPYIFEDEPDTEPVESLKFDISTDPVGLEGWIILHNVRSGNPFVFENMES